ncbi:periplasmic heavy metal sensor [Thioalkalivibrio sp. ALE19]|uniref:periplasmic heavy metal sensor n=1 Tax=Thioalkalivibrio sp. ALE19 TaxID=1266909 RepID=UPI00048DAB74|nr:periplasmic heavy metal sensor [Thioalkalivibrio sp. ALE19]
MDTHVAIMVAALVFFLALPVLMHGIQWIRENMINPRANTEPAEPGTEPFPSTQQRETAQARGEHAEPARAASTDLDDARIQAIAERVAEQMKASGVDDQSQQLRQQNEYLARELNRAVKGREVAEDQMSRWVNRVIEAIHEQQNRQVSHASSERADDTPEAGYGVRLGADQARVDGHQDFACANGVQDLPAALLGVGSGPSRTTREAPDPPEEGNTEASGPREEPPGQTIALPRSNFELLRKFDWEVQFMPSPFRENGESEWFVLDKGLADKKRFPVTPGAEDPPGAIRQARNVAAEQLRLQ